MNITNENIDNRLRELVGNSGLEKPNTGFADSIMDKIELSEQKKPELVSTPLISTSGWMIIIVIIFVMFSLTFLLGSPSEIFNIISGYTEQYKFQPITINYNIPSTYLFGLFGFLTFFLIEISLLRRKFNRI